jgi:mono/diheme cytochrome c family protein
MGSARSMALLIGLACVARAGLAEDTRVVDFARDVQPLLKTHCIDCHGPNEQKNGFRLEIGK